MEDDITGIDLRTASRDEYKRFYETVAPHCSNRVLTRDNPRVAFVLNNIKPGDRVLEVGCQDGGQTRILSEVCKEIVTIDIVDYYVHMTSELNLPNVTVHNMFAEDIDYIEEFDAIVLTEILEHFQRTKPVLDKIYAALKPGGKMMVTVPRFGMHDDKRGEHLREYEPITLAYELVRSGFIMLDTELNGIYIFAVVTK